MATIQTERSALAELTFLRLPGILNGNLLNVGDVFESSVNFLQATNHFLASPIEGSVVLGPYNNQSAIAMGKAVTG